VRWDAGPDAGLDAPRGIRNQIASIDPHLNIFQVQTLSEYLERSRSSTRFAVQTYGGIGVFGLVLAGIGLAGVTAYAVAQRRKEIAIRTAVGASSAQVLRLVAWREGNGAGKRRNGSGVFGRDGAGKNTFGADQYFCGGA